VALFSVAQAQVMIRSSKTPLESQSAALCSLEGHLQFSLENYSLAYDKFSEAYQLFTNLGNRVACLRTQLGMGSALEKCGKRKSARSHYIDVLQKATSEGFLKIASIVLSNLAEISFLDGEHEKAEHYAMKSNRLARSMDNHIVLFRNQFYLWKIALATKDDTRASQQLSSLKKYYPRVDKDLDEAKQLQAFLSEEAK
jgi:Flp pilus assembly protein TadD